MTSPLRLSPRTAAAATRDPREAKVSSKATAAVSRPVDGFERKSVTQVYVLQRGMTGQLVTQLQEKLVKARFMPLADFKSGPGVYGPRTEAAVKRLQTFVGLPATGIAGPSTFAALNNGTRYVENVPRNEVPRQDVTGPITHTHVLARLGDSLVDEVTQPMAVPL
ncbi:MAG: peptidoglycan-binding domain-containing protein [Myxococcaceae bacterium]